MDMTTQVPAPPTLVVFAHPAYHRSRVQRAMLHGIVGMPSVMVHDLYEVYPDHVVEVRDEQALLTRHDLIVLQFPFYWYSCPSLTKEWLDVVWLHGFAYGQGGAALAGRTLMVAISTGGQIDAYGPGGMNRYAMAEFLRPFERTAALCGMHWAPPFVVHGAALLGPGDLDAAGRAYRDHLDTVRAGLAGAGDPDSAFG